MAAPAWWSVACRWPCCCASTTNSATGMNRVNPIATIMAAQMMLNYLGEKRAVAKIKGAVMEVLSEGKVRTKDLGGSSTTSEMSDAITSKVKAL